MKRRWRLLICFLMAGCWLSLFSVAQAQTATLPPQARNPAQTPRPLTDQPISAPASTIQNPDDYLRFDAEAKTDTITNGAPQGHFAFVVTNISSGDVIINYMTGSCACTKAQMPSQPWKLAPNAIGHFTATMDMAGTPAGGSKFKTVRVSSDKGIKLLSVTTRVLPDMSSAESRTNAVKMATADRQAVFKSDCMQCHADTAKDSAGHDKMGQELYAAVCGVCHEAEHRATFVPDLHHLADATSAQFWRLWITSGKPGTLMPAFAKPEGGILSSEQIDSLVQYLSTTIPSHPATVGANKN